MYHAGVLKVTQRLTNGFLFQGSYPYSKLMTDADSFNGSNGSMDTAQPELEYSIGRLDQTHSIKLSTVYELPFGPGRRWVTEGVASHVIGGWRIAAVQSYSSGLPSASRPARRRCQSSTGRTVQTSPASIGSLRSGMGKSSIRWRSATSNRAAFLAPVGSWETPLASMAMCGRPWNMSEN